MKNKRILAAVTAAALTLSAPAAFADVNLSVNGWPIYFEQPLALYNERTMVPIREFFEAIGGTVIWLTETNQARVFFDGKELLFTLGGRNLYVNGQPHVIPDDEPAPMLIDGKTVVHIRQVAEPIGYEVGWDAATGTVTMNDPHMGEDMVHLDTAGTVDTTNTMAFDYGSVVIDPGNGGGTGANYAGVTEDEISLAISLRIRDNLAAAGYNVILTRDADYQVSSQGRVDTANRPVNGGGVPAVFVSIHCNSFDDTSANGTQVYYDPDSMYGTVLAQNIYNEILAHSALQGAQVHDGSTLYVVRMTRQPAVRVETAYLSNDSDRAYLVSAEGQSAIAEGITAGIIRTINQMMAE